MELSEHEKQVVIAYRKAPSDLKYSINKLLDLEKRCPKLRVVKGNNNN